MSVTQPERIFPEIPPAGILESALENEKRNFFTHNRSVFDRRTVDKTR